MKILPKPRKTPRQARSQHMVETILAASARVLAEKGYAGTNTNLVAERAGVSVGSVYQYFPNKDSLVAALHERHSAQMHEAIADVLARPCKEGLRGRIAAIVRALLSAHMVEPDLHRVLEIEFPFFDAPKEDSAGDLDIFRRVRALLEEHRREIVPPNRDLATWVVLRMVEAMVHAAVLDPPRQFGAAEIERSIGDAVMGYLTQPRR